FDTQKSQKENRELTFEENPLIMTFALSLETQNRPLKKKKKKPPNSYFGLIVKIDGGIFHNDLSLQFLRNQTEHLTNESSSFDYFLIIFYLITKKYQYREIAVPNFRTYIKLGHENPLQKTPFLNSMYTA
ncbi:hypothetical protein PanWU01x14_293920, partial [Parasponia andersonii]